MLRPPGPEPHFLIGNIPLASPDPLAIFTAWARKYGDIFYYRAAWLHVYFLNRPDLIDYVLVRNPQNFQKDKVIQNSRWLLGNGLLTAEGDEWRRQRRIIQPAFSRQRLDAYALHMTAAAEQMLAGWQPGTIVNIHEEMMMVTLRVVMRALFGLEGVETTTISRALNTVMRNSVGARLLTPPWVRYLPLPGMRSVRHCVEQMNAAVYQIIRQRRNGGRGASDDFLSLLLEARDDDGSVMTDVQLRDEIMTFLLAGHETTALTLTWALYLIDLDAGVEGKLHHELDRVLGERLTDISDLPALVYTEQVLKETMRLYPPAWSLARTAVEEFELDGYRIPRGANIVMSQWIMHRDPRYFADPEKFDPERWATTACRDLPRFAYFPFGGGPRQCIGASFATAEAMLILATIASRVRLVAVDRELPVAVPSLTLRPRSAIRMRIEARAHG